MDSKKPLSPCVQSAVRTLPEQVTSWELARYLFGIHPEYVTPEVKTLIPSLDHSFEGERKNLSEWLETIADRYPRENLLHSGLVIIGLFYVDPSLNALVPKETITSVENRISFS